MKARTWLDSVLLASCWGPSYLFIKLAVEEVPPLAVVSMRVLVGSLFLFTFMRARGQRLPAWGPIWYKLLFVGLVSSALPWTLFCAGEQYIASSVAAIINGLVPMAVALLAHYFLEDEPFSLQTLVGLVCGLFGLILLVGATLADGDLGADTYGVLCIVAACLSYAVGIVFARKKLRGVSSLVAPTAQLLMAALWVLPVSYYVDSAFYATMEVPSTQVLVALAYLAIPGSALAFVFYYRIIEHGGATAVGVVIYLLPVVGMFLGVFVNGEKLGLAQYLGFISIVLGMLITNGAIKLGRRPLAP